jgi:Uma2 family endonuclease
MTMIAAKWRIEEYHRMVAADILSDRKVELLQGEIVEMPPEGEPHAYCSHEAADYLSRLLGDRATIRQAKPITLPNDSEPEPDLAIVQPLGRDYREHHPYSENIFWLIEYANSSLEKDLEIKSKVYAQVGIPEYWVVNLKKSYLVVFKEPLDGEYATKLTLTAREIKPILFPDLSVAVAQIINS